MNNFALKIGLGIILVILKTGESGAYSRPKTSSIIDRWHEANDFCRGGSGDDKDTLAWCSVREALSEVLAARDWCYGKQSEAEYQHKWHKCTTDSIR